jgi:hypothetical protein
MRPALVVALVRAVAPPPLSLGCCAGPPTTPLAPSLPYPPPSLLPLGALAGPDSPVAWANEPSDAETLSSSDSMPALVDASDDDDPSWEEDECESDSGADSDSDGEDEEASEGAPEPEGEVKEEEQA